ncbi:MAG TPA: hypothetical protein VKV04_21730, partial [Verrucomicrobiae bacterium]|nr:hypothetical protein [Verrucomicrobiae bacterium]
AYLVSNNFVGDPEWIGVLERPQEMHSSDNKFVSRYAYLVVPAGSTLDINAVHNRAKRLTLLGEGFYRNQGVGTYEDNLAGFLADLNTNMWWTNGGASQYFYNLNPGGVSSGLAFSNANDLLSYRYGNSFGSLVSARKIFATNALAWIPANIDLYASGPLMLGNNTNILPVPPVAQPWSGADNTNHIFSIQDFYDSSKLPGSSFPANLQALGTSNDSYDEYTFTRLISQLGSDSAPEQGKMNINWKNTDIHGNVMAGMETNLIPWIPIDFFTNAADRMFRQLNMRDLNGNLITVTNIPFYEDPLRHNGTNINFYTPAVHRVLQLAANIYDASSSRYVGNGPTNYPSVFRPTFSSQNGVGYISGYVEVTNTTIDPSLTLPFLNASNFVIANQSQRANFNIYGVPWVIGAKKGFPTFNAMAMYNDIAVTRKLEFTNITGKASPPWQTNQLFEFGITNSFGIEGWNSYTNAYGRNLALSVFNYLTLVVTNQAGIPLVNVNNVLFQNAMPLSGWPQWGARDIHNPDSSFIVPLYALNNYTNANYLRTGTIVPIAPTTWTTTTNARIFMGFQFKLQYYLVDTTANRVVDFVNLIGTRPAVDVTTQLGTFADASGTPNNERVDPGNNVQTPHIWETNLQGGTLIGVINQMQADENTQSATHKAEAINFITELGGNTGGKPYFEDWYHPPGRIFQSLAWQVNDPMVHYMGLDLENTNLSSFIGARYDGVFQNPPANPELGILTNLNYAYQPWGGYHLPNGADQGQSQNGVNYDFNYQIKDAGVQQSDGWDFPTNKFWDAGVLGRVHRGTPWQTINLKQYLPTLANSANWTNWNNDKMFTYTNLFIVTNGNNQGFNTNMLTADGLLSSPNQDYLLYDLFTTAPNDNSTRGQLNVNQPGMAAWSAILSGVNVLSNSPAGQVSLPIAPAGIYDPSNPTPVAAIVQGINNTRTNSNITNGFIFPNGAFQRLGDILNVPQLTYASPFLNTNGLSTLAAAGLNDEALERIPQQVMSLLTLNQNPRFVIYSFGQTLHPANSSLVVGGTFNGLCTNYQITAEIATRAVVRVDGSPDPKYTRQNPDPQGRYYPPRIVVEQFNVLGPE